MVLNLIVNLKSVPRYFKKIKLSILLKGFIQFYGNNIIEDVYFLK